VNKVLRRVFLCKREEVTGGRRKLHIENIHKFCYSSNIMRIIKSRRRCIQNDGRKLEGKRTLGRLQHRYEDNIRIDLTQIS
jgi:hypothetical protein